MKKKIDLFLKKANTNWWEVVYLLIYAGILIHDFLDTTVFNIVWPSRMMYLFFAAITLFVLAKLKWNNDYSKVELIGAGVLLLAFIIPSVITEYSFLFEIGFLIVGAKGIKIDHILKVYGTIVFILLLVTLIACQIGWIDNLVFVTDKGLRIAFGTIYPTDFAAHVFYLLAALFCVEERKISYIELGLVAIVVSFIFYNCVAYTSTIAVILLMLAALFVRWYDKKERKKNYLFRVVAFVPVVCTTIIMLGARFFAWDRPFLVKANDMVNDRFYYGAFGLYYYGLKPFGQNVTEIGFGRTPGHTGFYFFLDDSYIRIAICYGVVLLLVVLAVLIISHFRALNAKRWMLFAAMIIVCVHSFMEHHLLELAYNPFLFCLFADLTRNKKSKEIT